MCDFRIGLNRLLSHTFHTEPQQGLIGSERRPSLQQGLGLEPESAGLDLLSWWESKPADSGLNQTVSVPRYLEPLFAAALVVQIRHGSLTLNLLLLILRAALRPAI